jgi:hypothetical protein
MVIARYLATNFRLTGNSLLQNLLLASMDLSQTEDYMVY